MEKMQKKDRYAIRLAMGEMKEREETVGTCMTEKEETWGNTQETSKLNATTRIPSPQKQAEKLRRIRRKLTSSGRDISRSETANKKLRNTKDREIGR